jgi:tetratricopeptide (TPR) repeat protein
LAQNKSDSSAVPAAALAGEVKDPATIAWEKLEKKDFSGAIDVCKEGLKNDPENLYLTANLAHAYLFSGKYDEAMDLYRNGLGKVFDSGMTWREMIRQDFDAFKALGFDADSMNKVLKDPVIEIE